MPTPDDFRRDIDEPLQRFFAKWGDWFDFVTCMAVIAMIAFCAGYAIGAGR